MCEKKPTGRPRPATLRFDGIAPDALACLVQAGADVQPQFRADGQVVAMKVTADIDLFALVEVMHVDGRKVAMLVDGATIEQAREILAATHSLHEMNWLAYYTSLTAPNSQAVHHAA